jgi:hypothetical protein
MMSENDNFSQKTLEDYSSFKKVTSDNGRQGITGLVPKLKIDERTEYEEGKVNSQRKKKIIVIKKRPQGSIQNRRFSSKSSQSSYNNLSKPNSDGNKETVK